MTRHLVMVVSCALLATAGAASAQMRCEPTLSQPCLTQPPAKTTTPAAKPAHPSPAIKPMEFGELDKPAPAPKSTIREDPMPEMKLDKDTSIGVLPSGSMFGLERKF